MRKYLVRSTLGGIFLAGIAVGTAGLASATGSARHNVHPANAISFVGAYNLYEKTGTCDKPSCFVSAGTLNINADHTWNVNSGDCISGTWTSLGSTLSMSDWTCSFTSWPYVWTAKKTLAGGLSSAKSPGNKVRIDGQGDGRVFVTKWYATL